MLCARDSEGRRTQMVYPKGRYRDTGSQGAPWMRDARRTLNYTYDSMGRAHTLAEPSGVATMARQPGIRTVTVARD